MNRSLRLLALVLALALPALAQEKEPFDPATAPRVTKAVGSRNDGSAGLGDRISLAVTRLDKVLGEVDGNCRALVLFLDEIALTGMPAESCDPYSGEVQFLLDRNPDDERNDAAWHSLLGSPTSYTREVEVSVGASDQFSIPTNVRTFRLFILPKGMLRGFLVLVLIAAVGFILLCARTNLIRSAIEPAGGGYRPFSLARSQMAFWSFIVLAGYVFCWMITGELDTISESVLALIGIGAGTALGGALIDTTGTDTSAVVQPSQGFLTDILSDGNGISIHRFQMFAWTLTLGGIFCISVYNQLSMPDFNATLLGLMGISSGTYLGFKFPEKKNQEEELAKATNGTSEPTT